MVIKADTEEAANNGEDCYVAVYKSRWDMDKSLMNENQRTDFDKSIFEHNNKLR